MDRGPAAAASDEFQAIPRAISRTGRQTAYARLKVKLTGYRVDQRTPSGSTSQVRPPDGPPWSMEIEAAPVSFNVVDRLPDDYLKAKTTPQFDAQVRRGVVLAPAKPAKAKAERTTHLYRKTDTGEHIYTHSVSYAHEDLPAVNCWQSLPVDLAFRARWHVPKLNQTFDSWCPLKPGGFRKASGFLVVPKGHADEFRLFPAEELLKALTEPGEHDLAIRITLEPSLEGALNFPEVDGYWPGTIELPETTVRFKVSKSQKEAEEGAAKGSKERP
jgi:hypothetical protein